ncbi:hypothetical protein ABVK25_004478 [Lepraria finkii]|uniref:CENP-V/GFA domain-containing protein n=1 Tax=Lepraria finkii TaxID=1340010 RepID=A0ABR4BBV4_9LECA
MQFHLAISSIHRAQTNDQSIETSGSIYQIACSTFSQSSKHPEISNSPISAMPVYKGGCYCGELKYTIDVSPDDARMTLYYCKNCKKLFGTTFGLTTKSPISSFSYTSPTRRSPLYTKPTMAAALIAPRVLSDVWKWYLGGLVSGQ